MDNLNINQQNKSRIFVIISILIMFSGILLCNSNPDEADIVRAARAKVKSTLEKKLKLAKYSGIDYKMSMEEYAESLFLEEEVEHNDSWIFNETSAAINAIDGSSLGTFGELLKNVETSYFQDYILESINNKPNRKCKNYLFFTNCDFFHDDRLFMSCNGKLGDVVCEYNPPFTK